LIFDRADVTDIAEIPENPILTGCSKRYFRLAARDIARFQFVIEGHEGVATVSTVDKRAAVVMLCIPEGCERDVDRVLESLRRDMKIDFREETV